jgi:hypothetical protein
MGFNLTNPLCSALFARRTEYLRTTGEVIEHKDGYRAQFGCPKRLWCTPSIEPLAGLVWYSLFLLQRSAHAAGCIAESAAEQSVEMR